MRTFENIYRLSEKHCPPLESKAFFYEKINGLLHLFIISEQFY